MKKKLLVLLCVVALLISVGVVTASAAAHPEAAECPHCGLSNIDWQEWNITGGGKQLTSGHYYLTDNLEGLTSQMGIGQNGTTGVDVVLDLRGFGITSSLRAFYVYQGNSLSLMDSNTANPGTVTGASTATGGVIYADGASDNQSVLKLYGGIIRSNSNTTTADGGAIYAGYTDVLIDGATIYGGAVRNGGAIYATRGANITLKSGTVNGGTATENGGAIYGYNGAVVNISGGTVIGGEAVNGGAVALMSATLNMNKGTLTGGKAGHYGGTVHLLADSRTGSEVACSVTVSGGTVNAGTSGSGCPTISAASNAHQITISGGTVNGSTSAVSGGSVYSGQGTAATLTVTGGTISGAASTGKTNSGVFYSRGTIDISGGTVTVTGGGPAVYMKDSYASLTMSQSVQSALSGKVRLVNDPEVNDGIAALQLVNGLTNGYWYDTGAEAVANASSEGMIRMFESLDLDLQGGTYTVDIGGAEGATISNGTVRGLDRDNNSYSGYGYVYITGTYEPVAYGLDGKTYIASKNGSKISFHRISLEIPYVNLRTTAGREGIYYTAQFRGDQFAIAGVESYGVAVTLQDLQTSDQWSEGMADTVPPLTVLSSKYTGGLSTTKVTEVSSTSLINIMMLDNDTVTNMRNAATPVAGRAYIKTASGDYLFGTEVSVSLQQVAQGADVLWGNGDLKDNEKMGFMAMYERFVSAMNSWTLPNLKADYKNTDLINQYRRQVVIDEMYRMQTILWTVAGDDPFEITIRATSQGLEADRAYDNSNLYTIYPGRIYKGLPYTHAAGNADNLVLMAGGETDANGAYVLPEASSVDFSGGCYSGSSAIAAYNHARIGNDCADCVSWAWARVSTSITFDQTKNMTPAKGCIIVGADKIGEEAIQSGLTANGEEYNLLYQTDANGNYVLDDKGNKIKETSGTYLICQNAGEQAMYEAYALSKPGDAMVKYSHGGGHSHMNVEIKTIRNNDGSINGADSKIVLHESGSGAERAQSKFSNTLKTYSTSAHNKHSTSSPTADCRQCALATGYLITENGQDIWNLGSTYVEYTFQRLYEAAYIPITCKELVENTTPAKVRVTDSKPSAANLISGIYDGEVSSTYRISAVTLTIYDANGQEVNRTVSYGIQDAYKVPHKLSNFMKDYDNGVLSGTPAITKNGNTITIDLPAGDYTYEYTCLLANGRTIKFRTGSFTV